MSSHRVGMTLRADGSVQSITPDGYRPELPEEAVAFNKMLDRDRDLYNARAACQYLIDKMLESEYPQRKGYWTDQIALAEKMLRGEA